MIQNKFRLGKFFVSKVSHYLAVMGIVDGEVG